MSFVQGLLLAVVVLVVSTAFGDLVSEEVRHRLDALPYALLRLAARRMPPGAGDDHLREWQGELNEILRGAEGLPITRFVRGLRYSAGLFRVAPAIARTIHGSVRKFSNRQRLGAGTAVLAASGFLSVGFLVGILGVLLGALAVFVGVFVGLGVASLSRPPLLHRSWRSTDFLDGSR